MDGNLHTLLAVANRSMYGSCQFKSLGSVGLGLLSGLRQANWLMVMSFLFCLISLLTHQIWKSNFLLLLHFKAVQCSRFNFALIREVPNITIIITLNHSDCSNLEIPTFIYKLNLSQWFQEDLISQTNLGFYLYLHKFFLILNVH